MTATESAPAKERWRAQWAELFTEVVTSGLCTGCAGCVVACPHDVLGYDDTNGVYRPFHLEEELGPGRLRSRPARLHQLHPSLPPLPQLGDRDRLATCSGASVSPTRWTGVSKDIFLARATDPEMLTTGPGRRAGLGHPAVVPRARPHRRRPGLLPRGRRQHVEGGPGSGPHPGGDPGLGRVPLHLLGQHPGLRRRRSSRAPSAWPWSG